MPNSQIFLTPLIHHVIHLSDWYWDEKIQSPNSQHGIDNEIHFDLIAKKQDEKNKQLIKNINTLIQQQNISNELTIANMATLREQLNIIFIKKIEKKIKEEQDIIRKEIAGLHLKRLKYLIKIALPAPKLPSIDKKNWLVLIKEGAQTFVKKIFSPVVNTFDDIANAIRGLGGLAEYILGAAVGAVHLYNLYEGIKGIKKAPIKREGAWEEKKILSKINNIEKQLQSNDKEAVGNETKLTKNEIKTLSKHQISRYKTRMVVNSLGIFTSLAGVATASAYIAHIAHAAFIIGPFLPAVFFGLLAVKSGLDLCLKISILTKANRETKEAKCARDNTYKLLQDQQKKVDEKPSVSEIKKLETLTKVFTARETHYQACIKARFTARKEVLFHAVELTLNTVVFVTNVVGNIFTLGALSGAIGIAAAVAGLLSKIYEIADKRYHFSQKIVDFFKKKSKKWFSTPSKKNIVETEFALETNPEFATQPDIDVKANLKAKPKPVCINNFKSILNSLAYNKKEDKEEIKLEVQQVPHELNSKMDAMPSNQGIFSNSQKQITVAEGTVPTGPSYTSYVRYG